MQTKLDRFINPKACQFASTCAHTHNLPLLLVNVLLIENHKHNHNELRMMWEGVPRLQPGVCIVHHIVANTWIHVYPTWCTEGFTALVELPFTTGVGMETWVVRHLGTV